MESFYQILISHLLQGLRRGTATVEEWHLWLDFEARSNSLGKMDGILSCLSAIAL